MRNAYKYLSQNCLTTPKEVDRLIISAFLEINQLQPKLNKFLQSYFIDESNKEEYSKLVDFITVINLDIDHFGFEELIELFEFVISPADRIINGAIYTPENIREYIVKETIGKQKEINELFKISDISCGCGGFLFNASIELRKKTNKSYSDIFRNHIFGLDIQEYSITRTKLLLSLLALSEGEYVESFSFNLFIGDALSFNWKSQAPGFVGFDVIIGNPPYVCSRNISEDSKKLLDNWEVCKSGHPDLYIPFFQIGIENLTSNGILGYITMNTFFKSVNGRALRSYLSRFDNTIIDFGGYQVFKSKSTYTCICFIRKHASGCIKYIKISSLSDLESKMLPEGIEMEVLDHFNGWNLQEMDLLHKIESVGMPLGEKFKTRNGIATLKNNIYIFSPVDEDDNFFYLQNGSNYPIEKGICRDIINSNKFTQIQSVDTIRQKVIFPYRYIGKNIEIISEKELAGQYPQAYKYLKDKKEILATRDKGKGQYEKWYAYGRNQSLEKMPHKLFFPHISSCIPNFIVNQEELLFYNGLALIGKNQRELLVMQKLMGSRLFWYYITKSSKPYGSGYFSLSRNYIKKFGIPEFSEEEINFLLMETDRVKINDFLDEKYGVDTSNKY